MHLLSQIMIGLVAVLHFYFFYLESVLWDTPKGRKLFRMTESQAAETFDSRRIIWKIRLLYADDTPLAQNGDLISAAHPRVRVVCLKREIFRDVGHLRDRKRISPIVSH